MSAASIARRPVAPPAGPRVAVVIPCFDDGATIRDAVDSVLAQEPCELVIVNDGSTDRATLQVLAELAEDGHHVIHQRNRGTSAARMTGVWATSAPFVFPLDADDAVLPGGLTTLADTLEERPALAAAWGSVAVFGEVERQERSRAATLDPWRITYFNNIPLREPAAACAAAGGGGLEPAGRV